MADLTRVQFVESDAVQAKKQSWQAMATTGQTIPFAGSHAVLLFRNTVTNAVGTVTVTFADDEDGRPVTKNLTLAQGATAADGFQAMVVRNEAVADSDGKLNVAGPTTCNVAFFDLP